MPVVTDELDWLDNEDVDTMELDETDMLERLDELELVVTVALRLAVS